MPAEANPSEARLAEVFAAALEKQGVEERRRYLEEACSGDPGLRSRAEALLRAHERADKFLDHNVHGEDLDLDDEGAGALIGPYRLIERLGAGGFGVVYRAEQTKPIHRDVALKIIKLGMDTRAVIARFEAERQALALMDHPNIAKVLDAGATNTGRPYFVMELVQGVRITDYCDRHCLSTPERLELFTQVCHAIQHAHQKGIIHRDLKPSNILVMLQDGVPVPKVIDFGIAKATGGQVLTDKTVYTAFDQFLGTPVYTSPEQAQAGGVDIDTRSDIYNLGVLLYELLTGKTPFEHKRLVAAGLDEIRRIIRDEEPPRPSTRLSTLTAEEQTTLAQRRQADPPGLIHGVRGDLDWIVMKCLEKDRARRYETANALAEDVSRHVKNEAVAARPPSHLYRFQKLVRRNKLVFASGAGIVAALLLGLGFSLWSLSKEQQARVRAVTAETIQSQLRQQAQAQARKSDQIARFLQDMLQGVGPSVALGRDTTMLKEILDKTAERLAKDLRDEPETEAELRTILGDVYYELGQHTHAEAMHRSALAILKALPGTNRQLQLALSEVHIGWDVQQQWSKEDPVPLFEEGWKMATNVLGTEDPQIAFFVEGLAQSRGDQGKFSEAEQLFRRAVTLERKRWGNDNRKVSSALSGLSEALLWQGRAAEAESATREALAIETRVLGSEPLWDLESAHLRLGRALHFQHKLDEAEAVLRRTLQSYRKVVGDEHWHVVDVLLSLAAVLIDKGELHESEQLTREAMTFTKKQVGDRKQFSFYVFEVLDALKRAGPSVPAEPFCRDILATARELPSSVYTLPVRIAVADLLREQGKLAEAEALYREGLEFCRKAPAPTSQDRQSVAASQDRQWLASGLSRVLMTQGKLADAEVVCREAVEVARKTDQIARKAARPQVLAGALDALGDVLRAQGKPSEAEFAYREAVEIGRKANDPYRLAGALAALGDLLRDQGRPTDAEPLYREGLDLCHKSPERNFENRQWLASCLGLMLKTQGKVAEAEACYRESVTDAASHWPEDPARWQWQVNDLIELLKTQGKLADAEVVGRTAVEIARKADRPQVLARALALLGDVLREQGKLAEADSAYREGLAICHTNSLSDLEGRQWLASCRGLALRTQGKLAEAEACYRESVTNAAKVWPKDPGRWQWQVNDLVDVLQRQGKQAEADQVKREFPTPPGNTNAPRYSESR